MQADRSLRSVFVGNIPYDTTEEKLRDVFSAVGPVLSFRIVFDRETGKPKGYGFCEYKDQETATSAIRNLNGHDLGGRQLRVDSASNERARDEPDNVPTINENQMQQHQHQHQLQHQHQAPPVTEPLVDAQTLINNVLCGLQPEQLFDLCKQLKTSLLVNPNETRQLLMQNPQLSYAILQSLVMIKAIDAQTAMNSLHRQLMQPAPMHPTMPLMPSINTFMGANTMLNMVTIPPGGMQPGSIQPGPMQPGPMQPGPMQPGPMQSVPIQPGPMQAGPLQPVPMQQGSIQQGPMQQGAMQPASIQSASMTAAPADPRLARYK